nr:uncharacterized protein LOC117351036 isoform X2 [Geotrypetes seraphini]
MIGTEDMTELGSEVFFVECDVTDQTKRTEIGDHMTEPETVAPQTESVKSPSEREEFGQDLTEPKVETPHPQVDTSKNQNMMTESGDSINEYLKRTKEALCSDISDLSGEKVLSESFKKRISDQRKKRRQSILRKMDNVSAEITAYKPMEAEDIVYGTQESHYDETHRRNPLSKAFLSDKAYDSLLTRISTQNTSQITNAGNKLRNLKSKHHYDGFHSQSLPDMTDFAPGADDIDSTHTMKDNEKNSTYGKDLGLDPAHNSSLIDLLSLCHFKVEQLEELKNTSKELATKLWQTKETVANFRQKIMELEMENCQKGREISFLSEELMESKRLLCEKNKEITDLKLLIRNFSNQLPKKRESCQPKTSSLVKTGHLSQSSEELQNKDHPSHSKICILF